jgi:hypothetical protein
VDTGGRYTHSTNDLTLGYARAQRDLGCVYTIGFYDAPVAGDPRPVTIRVTRPGLRAVHPSAYLFRTEEEKRESLLEAAFHAPRMFDRGVVRAHLFPLRPTSKDAWDGLLAVSFPVPFGDGQAGAEKEVRDFGAVLFRGSTVVHRFDRRLNLVPKSAQVRSAPLVTFVERVTLSPGSYRLAVVMADPESSLPHATEIALDVPELPRKELTVLEPILGTRTGSDLLLIASETGGLPGADRVGDAGSFRPLLVRQIEEPTDLVALERVCRIGRDRKGERDATVHRTLRGAAGDELATTPPVELDLESDSKVACQHLVDIVPAAEFPDGDYVFEVWVAKDGKDGPNEEAQPRGEARFAVASGSGEADGQTGDED